MIKKGDFIEVNGVLGDTFLLRKEQISAITDKKVITKDDIMYFPCLKDIERCTVIHLYGVCPEYHISEKYSDVLKKVFEE